MTAGNGDALFATGEFAEHLRAFLHGNATRNDGLEFAGVGGNGGGVDHEIEVRRDKLGVVVVMNRDAFGLELGGERTGCAVVATDAVATTVEVARQRAHSDASDAKKIVIHYNV